MKIILDYDTIQSIINLCSLKSNICNLDFAKNCDGCGESLSIRFSASIGSVWLDLNFFLYTHNSHLDISEEGKLTTTWLPLLRILKIAKRGESLTIISNEDGNTLAFSVGRMRFKLNQVTREFSESIGNLVRLKPDIKRTVVKLQDFLQNLEAVKCSVASDKADKDLFQGSPVLMEFMESSSTLRLVTTDFKGLAYCDMPMQLDGKPPFEIQIDISCLDALVSIKLDKKSVDLDLEISVKDNLSLVFSVPALNFNLTMPSMRRTFPDYKSILVDEFTYSLGLVFGDLWDCVASLCAVESPNKILLKFENGQLFLKAVNKSHMQAEGDIFFTSCMVDEVENITLAIHPTLFIQPLRFLKTVSTADTKIHLNFNSAREAIFIHANSFEHAKYVVMPLIA